MTLPVLEELNCADYTCDGCDCCFYNKIFFHYETSPEKSFDFCRSCFENLDEYLIVDDYTDISRDVQCDICLNKRSTITRIVSVDGNDARLFVCDNCDVPIIGDIFLRVDPSK